MEKWIATGLVTLGGLLAAGLAAFLVYKVYQRHVTKKSLEGLKKLFNEGPLKTAIGAKIKECSARKVLITCFDQNRQETGDVQVACESHDENLSLGDLIDFV